jgi:hypothetical protein
MIAGVHQLSITNPTPTDVVELAGMIIQVQELSIIAEKEINRHSPSGMPFEIKMVGSDRLIELFRCRESLGGDAAR